jgi:hypothetical protein
MRSFDHRNPSQPSNVFTSDFLARFGERDEPPSVAEADVAGPWHIEEIPALGFALCRAGESPARGYRPAAVFADRWLAPILDRWIPADLEEPE